MVAAHAGLAFFRPLFPEGDVRFSCFALFFCGLFFGMAGAFLGKALLFFVRKSGFLDSFLNARGMCRACRGDGPRANAAGLCDGQAEHVRVYKADLAVEQVFDGG